jgi:hypothetical protein
MPIYNIRSNLKFNESHNDKAWIMSDEAIYDDTPAEAEEEKQSKIPKISKNVFLKLIRLVMFVIIGLCFAYFIFMLWALTHSDVLSTQKASNPEFLNLATPYNLGEFCALLGLLSVSIPFLLKLDGRRCEVIGKSNLTFIVIACLLLSVAYTVRTPLLPEGVAHQGYMKLSDEAQLIWTNLMGIGVTFLSVLAVRLIWPRTTILLLILYLSYFISGHFLYNTKIFNNPEAFILVLLFSTMSIFIGLLALGAQRPEIEGIYAELKGVSALEEKRKKKLNALRSLERELEDMTRTQEAEIETQTAQNLLAIRERPQLKTTEEIQAAKDKEEQLMMAEMQMMSGGMNMPHADAHASVDTQALSEELEKLRQDLIALHENQHNETLAQYAELQASFEKLEEKIS